MITRSTFPTLAFAVLPVIVAVICGCGNPGPATSVYGKVTLDGKPVSGTIHFVGADGKEAASPVGPTGGTYAVPDPPLGEVTVLIKGGPMAAAPMSSLPGGPAMPGGTDKAAAESASVAPPAKYADASGGLKYTVTAGKQQKDFELTP